MNVNEDVMDTTNVDITINEVRIVIPSLILKVGEELEIIATHNNDKEAIVVASSKSLDFEEQIKTPAVFKKKMLKEGIHDLVLEFGKDNPNASQKTEMTITVLN